MDKEARLKLIRDRFKKLEEERFGVTDAVLPVTKDDIRDELGLMEGYVEHTRDRDNQ